MPATLRCMALLRPMRVTYSQPAISTLKTLLAVLNSVGMRLSVEPENHAHA